MGRSVATGAEHPGPRLERVRSMYMCGFGVSHHLRSRGMCGVPGISDVLGRGRVHGLRAGEHCGALTGKAPDRSLEACGIKEEG